MGTARDEIAAAKARKGCLGKAAPDEPVFILRARDVLAPNAVERWADELQMAMSSQGATSPARDTAKIREARALAHQMRAWQALHGSKLPD